MLINKMTLPDLKSQKVLFPTLLYVLVKMFIRVDHVSETLLFGLLCYMSLKYLTNLTITKTDIIIPTAIFFTFPQFEQTIDADAALFLVEYAFIRLIFPLN
jgi:hypothetical protein